MIKRVTLIRSVLVEVPDNATEEEIKTEAVKIANELRLEDASFSNESVIDIEDGE